MANLTYTLKPNSVDRIVYNDNGTIINLRVRSGEKVQIDLADPTQDAAVDESLYDQTGSGYHHKVKPSA